MSQPGGRKRPGQHPVRALGDSGSLGRFADSSAAAETRPAQNPYSSDTAVNVSRAATPTGTSELRLTR